VALKTYLSFSALLLIFLFETIFPYFKGRKHRVLHGAHNICLSLLNSVLYTALFSVLTLKAMQWSHARHIGLIYHISLPEPLKLVIAFILFDLWMYFWHRIHHSVEWSETNSNFASIFSFWDRIGQTFKYRKDTLTLQYGLQILKEKKWQNLPGMLLTPFKNFSFKFYILK